MLKSDFKLIHSHYLKSNEWQDLKAAKAVFCPPQCIACDQTAYLDLHHMRYPANLFDTAMGDVCWLCRTHHKAVYQSPRKIDEPWNRDTEYLIRMTRLIALESQ